MYKMYLYIRYDAALCMLVAPYIRPYYIVLIIGMLCHINNNHQNILSPNEKERK